MVLARLLTPWETGLYSVSAGIINIAQGIREFGVGNYIIQEKDLTRDRIATAQFFSIALGGFFTVLFCGSADYIAVFFKEPRIKEIVFILSFNFIAVGFSSIGVARLRRDMNFSANLRISIAATLTHSVISVTMAAIGLGAIGLAWASLGGIVTSIIGTSIVYPDEALMLPNFKEWRRVMSFGKFATGITVLQAINGRLPDVIVGRMLGLSAAGIYSRANGLITLFNQALMNAISPVTMTTFAKLHREGENLASPYLLSLSLITAVAWPSLFMIAVLAQPIIDTAFGEQWLPAVPLARVFCLVAAFEILGAIAISIFSASGKVRHLLLIQLVTTPIEAAALIIGGFYNIELIVWGLAGATLLKAIYTQHKVNQEFATSWKSYFAALLPSIALTVSTGAIPAAIYFYFKNDISQPWIGSALSLTFGGISWYLAISFTEHPLDSEIRSIGVLLISRWPLLHQPLFKWSSPPPPPNRDGKPLIHLINPMTDSFGGSEQRTLQLFNILSAFADVKIWSEYEVDPRLKKNHNIININWKINKFPKRGTFVFVGFYYHVGNWYAMARQSRTIVICNTPDQGIFETFYRRLVTFRPHKIELVFASSAIKDILNKDGTIHESPIDVNAFKPKRKNISGIFTVGRLSRDTLDKHNVLDISLYNKLDESGVLVKVMGGTVLRTFENVRLNKDITILCSGAVDNVEFLQSLDCFVYRTSDSWFEAFGRVVFEAMACGIPVVVHRRGGYAEFLTHEKDSLIFDTNEEAFKYIMKLKEDLNYARLISRNARIRVEDIYSKANEAEIINFYIR